MHDCSCLFMLLYCYSCYCTATALPSTLVPGVVPRLSRKRLGMCVLQVDTQIDMQHLTLA